MDNDLKAENASLKALITAIYLRLKSNVDITEATRRAIIEECELEIKELTKLQDSKK